MSNGLRSPILEGSGRSSGSGSQSGSVLKDLIPSSINRAASSRAVLTAKTTRKSFFSNTTGSDATWTLADQRRLASIDALHTRMLEFHNNVHMRSVDEAIQQQVYELSTVQPLTRGTATEQSLALLSANLRSVSHKLAAALLSGGDIVATATIASKNSDPQAPFAQPVPMSRESLQSLLMAADTWSSSSSQQAPAPGVEAEAGSGAGAGSTLWIHITDLSVVGAIGRRYNIHDLCLAGFSDFRAHSAFVPVPGACFVSFCTFVMIGTDVSMNKVFVYLAPGLVITHEREVHPDRSVQGSAVPCGAREVVVSKARAAGSAAIVGMATHGAVFLLYSLACHALVLQDSIVDFFSRSLGYFKQMVHTRLHHRDKLHIHRKMHIVSVSIGMLQKTVGLNIDTFTTILKVAEGFPAPYSKMVDKVLNEAHLPYLLDLYDSFKFARHCLDSEFEETVALDSAMDSITTLRNINTSTLLSLVATIFLPLNFLTGVFGTNFQTSAGYSMELLSNPVGPYIFAAICVGSSMVIIAYFAFNGWVELRINYRRLGAACCFWKGKAKERYADEPGSRLVLTPSASTSINKSAGQEKEEDEDEFDVAQEETRRVRESISRRSLAGGAAPTRA